MSLLSLLYLFLAVFFFFLYDYIQISARKKVTFDLNVKTKEEPSTNEVATALLGNNEEKENEKQEERSKESKSFPGLIASSILSSPSNHRYQNCEDCDQEHEDDDDEVGNVHSLVQEES
jgi:hypothetical protein